MRQFAGPSRGTVPAGAGTANSPSAAANGLPLVPEVGVVALVPDCWNECWQPRHHILTRLARYYYVIWMNPAPRLWDSLKGPLTRRVKTTEEFRHNGFAVYRPEFWLPEIQRPRWLSDRSLHLRLKRASEMLDKRGVQRKVLYLWRPEFGQTLSMMSFDLSCYHLDDEYSFSAVEVPTNEAESKLLSRVDQVFVHSVGLLEKKGRINPSTLLVPNGVDYEAYSTIGDEPADLASIPRPRIGYTGWIKRHLDWDLVLRLTEQHQDWSFVLVGPQSPHPEISGPIRELSRRRNVYLLGAKSTTELTRYPQHFDVCIMPYVVNDYTKYIYPLKLHEYLASGRPTVGTRIRSLENFSAVVGLARTLEEWSAELRKALSPTCNAPECFSARQSVARRHDWHVLVEEIALTVAQRLGQEFLERVKNGERVSMNQAGLTVAATLPVPRAIASFPEERRLDRALLQGIAWTGTMKAAIQVLSWASTLVVARLLMPADYGLVGMATVYLGLVALVNEFGLGSAIVAQRKLTDDQIAQLNTLSVLLGALGFVFSYSVSGLLAAFFRVPELRLVVVAMSTTFLVTAFRTVPYSLLQRDLRFKLLAISEGLQSAVQALSMVVFAVLGFGYWTLVIGSLAGAISSTAILAFWRSHSFRRPRLASLKEAITFSWQILIGRISWYLYSNSDFFVAGRVLGKAALGAYTFAWDLASIPVDKISALVGRVTPAIFSAVQTERAALRRYLLNLTQGLAFVTIPATWGVGLIAEDLVRVVLGEKWLAAVPPLQILAAYASLRSITTLLAQILIVTGQSRFAMYNNIVGLLVLPTMFLVGSQWGTTGIATAWVVGFPCVAIPLYRRVFRTLGLSTAQYLGALWPMLSSSLVMLVFMLMLKMILPSSWPLPIRLALEVLCGTGSYLATLGIFHRETIRDFRQLFRKVVERDPAVPPKVVSL